MKIVINGNDREIINGQNLSEIIALFSKNTKHVIAEVNGQIVQSSQWNNRLINDGDSIELVNFVGGG